MPAWSLGRPNSIVGFTWFGLIDMTDWDTALTAMAEGLKGAVAQGGGVPPGFLAQPSSTVEEMYLLARIAQVCRSANIDHRLRQRDFRDQESDAGVPGLGQPLADVDALDALLLSINCIAAGFGTTG